MNHKLQLNASSLVYTILFVSIIALLLSGMIMISTLYKKANGKIEKKLDEIELCNFYYHSLLIDNSNDYVNLLKQNNSQIKSHYLKWGVLEYLSCKLLKKDTIAKGGLTIKSTKISGLSLCLLNNNESLKLVGKASIYGRVQMKNPEIETKNFNNLPFTGQLPNRIEKITNFPYKLKKFSLEMPLYNEMTMEEIIDNNMHYNSFQNPTILINANNKSLDSVKLIGNFILKSSDSLSIKKNTKLEDIIVIAPIVTIESGFHGSLQVSSKESIYIQSNVTLSYPSILYLKNDKNTNMEIKIEEHSKIFGNIIVTGENALFDIKRRIVINKNTNIMGQVFCRGTTELYGYINGCLYTHNFLLKTPTTSYSNYIKDASIKPVNQFDNYKLIPLFETQSKKILLKKLG